MNNRFRLYSVAVSRNNRSQETALSDTDTIENAYINGCQWNGASMFKFVRDMLKALLNKKLFYNPTLVVSKDVLLGSHINMASYTCFSLKQVTAHGNALEVELSKGICGQNDEVYKAVDYNNANTESLSGEDAVTRHHFVRLAFPESCNSFYVASSLRGTSDAALTMLNHLSYYSHMQASRLTNAGEVDIVRGRNWYKFIPTPEIDQNRLNSFMARSAPIELRLKQRIARNGERGDRDSELVVISMKNLNTIEVDKSKTLLQNWVDRFKSSRSVTSNVTASEVAAIFPQQALPENADWFDGEIVFEENQSTKSVSQKNIGKLFTYPMPKDTDYAALWDEANARLHSLSQAQNIEIPEINF